MKRLIQHIFLPLALMLFMASCAVEGRNDSYGSQQIESMYCTKNSCTIINKGTENGVTKSSQEILEKLDAQLKTALSGRGSYNTFLVSPANQNTQVVFVELDSAFIKAGINPHKVLVILTSSYFRKDRVEKTEQMVSLQSLKNGVVLYNVENKREAELEAVFLLTEVEGEFEELKTKLASDYVYSFTVNFKEFSAN